MSKIFVISDGVIVQEKDRQVWKVGINNVYFDQPFATDESYVFFAFSPNCVVEEIKTSRKEMSTQVKCSADTNLGYYRASGTTLEFLQKLMSEVGEKVIVQRGVFGLVGELQTDVTFDKQFKNDEYKILFGKSVTLINEDDTVIEKTVTGFKTNTLLGGVEWIAYGVAAEN
jgi:hypothetical protein